MGKKFEICVRGIIVKGNRILICKVKGKRNWFFPGGHVEFGEKAEKALTRELKEEIGAAIGKIEFIGSNENLYFQRNDRLHEINIVFKTVLKKNEFKIMEKHMEFKWADLSMLPKLMVYPTSVKKAVLRWKKDGKIFWSSQGFKE